MSAHAVVRGMLQADVTVEGIERPQTPFTVYERPPPGHVDTQKVSVCRSVKMTATNRTCDATTSAGSCLPGAHADREEAR